MRQFIEGVAADYEGLEQRATGRCIRFRDQEMPPGSMPSHANVGFEVERGTGRATLFVGREVCYVGDNQAVREWLRAGEKRFASFGRLRKWVQEDLAAAYMEGADAANASTEPLTDFQAVRQNLQSQRRVAYLDEDEVFNRLARRVRGQDTALRVLANHTCRHLAKPNPSRPAVYFSVGPTGVGKTHTAESLAGALSENGNDGAHCGYVRLDMAQYSEGHRVSELIGAPQGYVGYSEGSQLVDALRANPRSVVLFDEIEKAHPSILRALMNMMDAGRLSTAARSNGTREIDCRQTIIIFTSNLEAGGILEELEQRNGFGQTAVEDEVCRRRLKAAGISPEIVGRIGRFLVYRQLNDEARAEIVALSVAGVGREYGLEVQRIEPQTVICIMETIWSQGFGARPERYQIDEVLGGVFAKAAAERMKNPVSVKGPPFECVTAESAKPDGA